MWRATGGASRMPKRRAERRRPRPNRQNSTAAGAVAKRADLLQAHEAATPTASPRARPQAQAAQRRRCRDACAAPTSWLARANARRHGGAAGARRRSGCGAAMLPASCCPSCAPAHGAPRRREAMLRAVAADADRRAADGDPGRRRRSATPCPRQSPIRRAGFAGQIVLLGRTAMLAGAIAGSSGADGGGGRGDSDRCGTTCDRAAPPAGRATVGRSGHRRDCMAPHPDAVARYCRRRHMAMKRTAFELGGLDAGCPRWTANRQPRARRPGGGLRHAGHGLAPCSARRRCRSASC